MPEPLPKNDSLKKEFICDSPCVPATSYKMQLGKKFATALTGFVAGVIVATIMLYPWIKFLGDFCPNVPQNGVTAPNVTATDDGVPAAPAPAPENPAPGATGTFPAPEPGGAPTPPPATGVDVDVSAQ